MRSISRLAIDLLLAASVLFCGFNVFAESCNGRTQDVPTRKVGREYVSAICASISGESRQVDLIYDQGRAEIFLKSRGHRFLVERLGAGFDPGLVGSIGRIRLLPSKLQPYLSQGVVLFVSSKRSTSGGGGGQCGSGSEDFLNVVDVNGRGARVIARYPIGSCVDGIELSSIEKYEDFNSFWVDGGKLYMQFLFYEDRCEDRLTAYVSPDFRRLRFVKNKVN